MREYLFRGKRIDNGELVEGFYVCLNSKSHRIYNGCAETDCGDYYPAWFEVIPETVGQYTGLKDKNGVRIFEGDIITIPDSKKMGLPAPIRYDYVRATFEVSRSGYNPLSLIDSREFYEVIGNIHDNPELLKEGGEE